MNVLWSLPLSAWTAYLFGSVVASDDHVCIHDVFVVIQRLSGMRKDAKLPLNLFLLL